MTVKDVVVEIFGPIVFAAYLVGGLLLCLTPAWAPPLILYLISFLISFENEANKQIFIWIGSLGIWLYMLAHAAWKDSR